MFNRQPEITRNIEAFREKIGGVETAADLLADRQMLSVALGAFGLDEEIDKRAFLRKMLEEGVTDQGSFANRFADTRYKSFVAAFGFGDPGGARTGDPGFADRIISAYKDRQFEIVVGDQDSSMRIALNFRREIGKYASMESEGAAWFSIMGDQQLRAVFEGAFNLPASFAQLDVDKQRDELASLSQKYFGGGLELFQDSAKTDEAISRFLIRRSINEGPSATTPGASALTLLQSGLGSAGTQNLLLSGLL